MCHSAVQAVPQTISNSPCDWCRPETSTVQHLAVSFAKLEFLIVLTCILEISKVTFTEHSLKSSSRSTNHMDRAFSHLMEARRLFV